MNAITHINVMFRLQAELMEHKILPKEVVERMTGLSERSICAAYFAETGEWIVKVDPQSLPSRMTMVKHVSYMRLIDIPKSELPNFKRYLRRQKEGLTRNIDSIIEAIDDILGSF
jgi:hypothetical protein